MKAEGFDYNWTRCRDKWRAEGTIYKRLSDYQNMSGKQDYFSMSYAERKEIGLPPDYSLEQYNVLGSFMKDRANINPPGVRDSGKRRRKRNHFPVSVSVDEEDGNTSMNDEHGVSRDDYSTGFAKKDVQKRRRRYSSSETEVEEIGLKETLTEVNNSSCDKMASIFTNVMEKASEREDKNIEKLVKAGHEDIATILLGLKDIFGK